MCSSHLERLAKGPYNSLFDFCERLDSGTVNRTAIESLVKAGAFDALGGRRSQLFDVIDRALQSGASAAADRRHGQMSLFGDDVENGPAQTAAHLPNLPEWNQREKLSKEKEVLGFYLTSHPLAEHQAMLDQFCSHTSVEAAALKHRTEVMLGGMLGSIKIAHTRNAKPGKPTKYAMFDLEDKAGALRTIVWPEPFAQYGELVQPDAILMVRGVIDKRPGSEEANLIANELIRLADVPSRCTKGIMIRVLERQHGEHGLEQLYEILRGYPGSCPVQLHLCLDTGVTVACPCQKLRVEVNNQMRDRVDELLGPGNIRMLAATNG